MLDIIFISYDEPNADRNFDRLKTRFPHARRIHGVKGIANAHIAASKKAMTKFFFVVDADAIIKDDFNFDFQPVGTEEHFVHIWMAENPVGLTYGYGGVKLFSKAFFRDIKNQIDFSTTLTKDVKYHFQVSCITEFNSDKYRAFRGAFRECAKLTHSLKTSPSEITHQRLETWMNPPSIPFREFVVAGAVAGAKFAADSDELSLINEHDVIESELKKKFGPEQQKESGIGHQFFFLTRIASVLYDASVLASLSITELRDAISDGQIYSKVWLVEELSTHIKSGEKIAVLGGWIGTLSLMMKTFNMNVKVTSVDIDRRANRIAEKLNYDFEGFSALTQDMYTLDYNQFDVIVNTSSEHIEDIAAWRSTIPAGKIIAVQNNNFTGGAGHISCVQSAEELKAKLNLSEIFYVGTKAFPQYDRYMIIGRT